MKYRKKPPVVIDAVQWKGKFTSKGFLAVVTETTWSHDGGNYCQNCKNAMRTHGAIETLEGTHIVCPYDWVIKGIKGEFYACKPDIFEKTYEKVNV